MEEIYERVNLVLERLNKTKDDDSFFLLNKDNLYEMFMEEFSKYPHEAYSGVMRNNPLRETIFDVYSFLRTCSLEMAEDFLKCIKEGKILFNRSSNRFIRRGNEFNITIRVTNTIRDTFNLLHEYIHKASTDFNSENESDLEKSFSEMVAIYGELELYKFLLEKGKDRNDMVMVLDYRRNGSFKNLCDYLIEYPMHKWVEEGNSVDANFYKENMDAYKKLYITENYFNRLCRSFINKGCSSTLGNYKYVYGLFLAAYYYSNSQENLLLKMTQMMSNSVSIDFFFDSLLEVREDKLSDSLKVSYGHK